MQLTIDGNEVYSSILINQIHTIAEECKNYVPYLDPGLSSGKAGISLLYGYLAKIFPDRYSSASKQLLYQLAYSLQHEVANSSISSGISGIVYSIQHTQNLTDFKVLNADMFKSIDGFLEEAIEGDIEKKNWDPLHGYIGIGIYFLERDDFIGQAKILNKIVDALYNSRTSFSDWALWVTPAYKNVSKDNINFGMAHGIPGIISFLSLVARKNIAVLKCYEMVNQCLSYFSTLYGNLNGFSFYPSNIEFSSGKIASNSRIAWCYGDLCISNAYIHAGKVFRVKKWFDHGIKVASDSVKRDFSNTGISDASFCHGTAGVMHQYNRYYQLTKNEIFKQGVTNMMLINKNLFYNSDTGIGGYQQSIIDEKSNKRKLIDNPGLLEGSSGIALVYVSIIFNIPPKWDLIFLTNI